MNYTFEEFTFKSKQINARIYETILIHKDGIRFGILYNSNQSAPNEFIFSEFQKNPNAFFIDVDLIQEDKPPEIIPLDKVQEAM